MVETTPKQEVSLYLLFRIRGRLAEWNWSMTRFAKEVGESLSNVSRMLDRSVSKIGYLPKVREVLHIPADELDTLWGQYSEDVVEDLATVMAASPDYAKDFLEDVDHLAKLYKRLQRVHDAVALAGAAIRTADNEVAESKARSEFAELKKKQAKLEKSRRELRAIVN